MACGNRGLLLALVLVLLAIAVGARETPQGIKGVAGQLKGARILATEAFSRHTRLPHYLAHIPRRKALATTCTRTTVTIRSQNLGPFDLQNDIFNMTFYNGCAYNVTSPLRVWKCFNFNNIWDGSLDNPTPNPSQYQLGPIFGQSSPEYCEMWMNRGASGDVQMFPGETVNVLYAWTHAFLPCAHDLHFSNGNTYSMTNTTDCVEAETI
ncbi:hypothetical protein CLOM_g613 [Closterium sp. NIES-68]|nr:hypothetical protein CLOM_g613 [Closterium sp. NIES-68]GJP57587.1 hypothetical protein CLOP_g21000 [Closterium sp. NIES-67]GJP75479.1 hypothetical protein CLOP_g5920 [Closterium sp. NIES-67]